jgi:hypothetical protein
MGPNTEAVANVQASDLRLRLFYGYERSRQPTAAMGSLIQDARIGMFLRVRN